MLHPAVTVLLVAAVTATETTLNFTLVHVNDMHARYEETNKYSGSSCFAAQHNHSACYGGYARVASIIKQARAADNNTLVLNAGDNYQGTVYYSVFKWNISAYFNNLLGFDATTLGNHEFDDHISGLAPYIKGLTSPLVVANADFSKEASLAELNISKSTVVERDGVKIGIVGYITPETAILSNADNVTFMDEITALRQETERLKAQNVNIIIGLGHSGYFMDQRIAAQVPEIDLVVGGHSHSFLYSGTQPDLEVPVGPYPTWVTQNSSGKRVPVVQAYAFTKYVGKLYLSFNSHGDLLTCEGSPILLNGSVEQDSATSTELDGWTSELSEQVKQVIGRTDVLLDGGSCRQQECNLGNLVADAVVSYRAEQSNSTTSWTDAPIALINSGSLRSSIDASSSGGNITLKDLIEAMPFDTLGMIIRVRGSVLLAALEHSVEDYVPGKAWRGSFLQMSGLHVSYDLSRDPGSRVASVSAKCGSSCLIPTYSPLNTSALYSLIVNSFVANGGDGYSMLSANEGSESLGETDAGMVRHYISKHSPVHPSIDNRIQFLPYSLLDEDDDGSTTTTDSSTATDSSTTTNSSTTTDSSTTTNSSTTTDSSTTTNSSTTTAATSRATMSSSSVAVVPLAMALQWLLRL